MQLKSKQLQALVHREARASVGVLAPKKFSPQGSASQERAYSCGPAALSNVCSALGFEVEEEEIRELAGTTEDGTDEHQLMHAAMELMLVPTVHHLGDEDEAWGMLIANASSRVPSLLCVDNWDHWVAVVGSDGEGSVIVLDPENTDINIEAEGVNLMSRDQLIDRWYCADQDKPFYSISFMRKEG